MNKNNFLNGNVLHVMALVGYVSLVLFMLTKPVGGTPSFLLKIKLPFPIDKCVHFMLFAPMPFLFLWCMKQKRIITTHWIALTSSIIIAVLSEILQRFIPYRDYDTGDLIADFIGIFFGWLFMMLLYFIVVLTKKVMFCQSK